MMKTVANRCSAPLIALMLVVCAAAGAQVSDAKKQSQGSVPPVAVHADGDAGVAGETPLDTASVPDPTDVSTEESPIHASRPGAWIKALTPLNIKLDRPVNSGVQRNGDTLTGVLIDPVKTSNGSVLRAGAPIKATVLTAAAAGKVQSAGVLSLQVFQVDGLHVVSNVLEFSGKEGHRDVADSNPDKGTEAIVPAGASLSFRALGSGDKADPNELPETGVGGGRAITGSVRAGQSTVGPPSGFARPAPGSTPTTEIHGATTPH